MAQHPAERADSQRNLGLRNDDSALAMNFGNPTQQFQRIDRRIILRHRVASRNTVRVEPLDQPVDEKPSVTLDQHDFARNDLRTSRALNDQDVAGPDRRKHTGAQPSNSYDASRAENLGRKI